MCYSLSLEMPTETSTPFPRQEPMAVPESGAQHPVIQGGMGREPSSCARTQRFPQVSPFPILFQVWFLAGCCAHKRSNRQELPSTLLPRGRRGAPVRDNPLLPGPQSPSQARTAALGTESCRRSGQTPRSGTPTPAPRPSCWATRHPLGLLSGQSQGCREKSPSVPPTSDLPFLEHLL